MQLFSTVAGHYTISENSKRAVAKILARTKVVHAHLKPVFFVLTHFELVYIESYHTTTYSNVTVQQCLMT
jgi:hypothetical protein